MTRRSPSGRWSICSLSIRARLALLYQNDDFGKDYVGVLREGLGADATKTVVAEATYEVTDPTMDSQIISLKASGADTWFNTGKRRHGH